jgi:demethylmenaquinone methyltransferase/2-methoxy-6-polyprenyl-1,4-benzoquinol methylase
MRAWERGFAGGASYHRGKEDMWGMRSTRSDQPGEPPLVRGIPSGPQFAIHLFNGAAYGYDLVAEALSYGQYHRWQTALVRVAAACGIGRESLVLDVATGTAGVARQLVRETGCRVIGIDQSQGMLDTARRKLAAGPPATAERISLLRASAEHLPFPERHFDGVTFTYLFRYVPDPAATLSEIVRTARPGAFVGFVEFHIPRPPWKQLWHLHTRLALPVAGRIISKGWYVVGTFLGPSIEQFYATWDVRKLCSMMERVGLEDVRYQLMSLGGGVVMWGRRKLDR